MTEAVTQAPPATAPPASLIGIPLRARPTLAPSKPGDITGRLHPVPAPAAMPAPAALATPIALPAPAAAGFVVPAFVTPPAPPSPEVDAAGFEPALPAALVAPQPMPVAPAGPPPLPAPVAAVQIVPRPALPAAELDAPLTGPAMAPPPVAPRPVPVAPAPLSPLPVITPSRDRHAAEDLLAYWNGLRRGRRLPAAVDLDRAAVAAVWPDSLLLSTAVGPAMAHIVRLGETSDDIEYTPMVTEWILSLGRRAALRADRLDVADSFPASGGLTRYRLLALPLAADDGSVEQVLCHLCRAQDNGARHERRGWFRA